MYPYSVNGYDSNNYVSSEKVSHVTENIFCMSDLVLQIGKQHKKKWTRHKLAKCTVKTNDSQVEGLLQPTFPGKKAQDDDDVIDGRMIMKHGCT